MYQLKQHCTQLTATSNQAIREQALQYITNLHYAPFQGIDSGSASSLPSLVLRSMLKQRRILMRMH